VNYAWDEYNFVQPVQGIAQLRQVNKDVFRDIL